MTDILSRVRDIVVRDSNFKTLALSLELQEMPKDERRKCFGGNHESGWFYLHANQARFPGIVFECVVHGDGGHVSALYNVHPVFASIGELMRTRDLLCRALGEKMGLDFRSIGVADATQGKHVGLETLATGQLIDLLTEEERRGQIIVPGTANYGLDHVEKTAEAAPKKELVNERLDEAGVMMVGPDGKVTVKSVKELDAL